jgi:nicotinamide-nucleotide amidase
MAENVARLLGADASIAVTGVGGPAPNDGLPAGTVWIATHVPGATRARLHSLNGPPRHVIEETCQLALAALADAAD